MSYKIEFDKIEKLSPKPRGFAFEKLINKIYDDCDVLINPSYKTADGSQQIDGAIEIKSRIFLIEAKWEDEKTLAASKLYSFLGKINSKIDGTLGVFISYNKLDENFISALRDGLKQNCIIIHGKEDIDNIVNKKVDLKEYTWYCFQQTSTKSKFVSTAEFISLPKKDSISNCDNKDAWSEIYMSLTGSDSLVDFSAKIETHYSHILELSKKIINIYNTIEFNTLIREKFNKLIEKLINEEIVLLTSSIVQKFKGGNWKTYAGENFCETLIKYNLEIEKSERKLIIENVTKVLNSDWEDENKASYVIEIFYKSLENDEKALLAKMYFDIYCDTSKLDKFQQKKLANKIFKDLLKSRNTYFDIIQDELISRINILKIDEYLFQEEPIDRNKVKNYTVKQAIKKYHKVFSENQIDEKQFIENAYDSL